MGAAPVVDLGDHATLTGRHAVPLPTYERDALRRSIVHLGVGGFHRSHLATYVDELCATGNREWAIVGAGILPADHAIADALTTQGGLYSLVERDHAQTQVRVIGSIVDYVLAADRREPLVEQLAAPDTTVASLTITEGGYPVDHDGQFDPATAAPVFEVLVEALDRRRRSNTPPLTVISCDNVSNNGATTKAVTVGVAEQRGAALAAWIDTHVAFPNSMVDRITPATTDDDRRWLRETHSIIDRAPVFTEPFRQWVLEDNFAAERPPWEALDILLTSDVEPYETLKLRVLNAAHSSLAYLAALGGYQFVHDAINNSTLRQFIVQLLSTEVRPVLPLTPGIDPAQYSNEVLQRFANPAIGDQIARLCLDGSSKFPKFLLPTLRGQLRRRGPIRCTTLALAGWCRYLATVDRSELAYDPRLDELVPLAIDALSEPRAFLSFTPVFGPDLPNTPRFADEFARSLRLLNELPVPSAIASAIGSDTQDGDATARQR